MPRVNFKAKVRYPSSMKRLPRKVQRRFRKMRADLVTYGRQQLDRNIREAEWAQDGPGGIADAALVAARRTSIEFTIAHRAASYHERGVRPHVMSYLPSNKNLPIELPDGTVIFRRATRRSIARGGWRHPGIEPKRMVQDAVEKTVEEYKRRAIRVLEDAFR